MLVEFCEQPVGEVINCFMFEIYSEFKIKRWLEAQLWLVEKSNHTCMRPKKLCYVLGQTTNAENLPTL